MVYQSYPLSPFNFWMVLWRSQDHTYFTWSFWGVYLYFFPFIQKKPTDINWIYGFSGKSVVRDGVLLEQTHERVFSRSRHRWEDVSPRQTHDGMFCWSTHRWENASLKPAHVRTHDVRRTEWMVGDTRWYYYALTLCKGHYLSWPHRKKTTHAIKLLVVFWWLFAASEDSG